MTGTGIYAEATARKMLQDKQYDRGVRGIRLVTEALLHFRNKSAEKWAVKNGLPWLTENIERNLDDLQYSVKSHDNGMTVDICKDMEDDLVKVHEKLDKFCFVLLYDRGVRGIRLVTEALLHLRNKSAEKWAVKNGLPWLTENIE